MAKKEIVDLPINSMVMFHSFFLCLPEGTRSLFLGGGSQWSTTYLAGIRIVLLVEIPGKITVTSQNKSNHQISNQQGCFCSPINWDSNIRSSFAMASCFLLEGLGDRALPDASQRKSENMGEDVKYMEHALDIWYNIYNMWHIMGQPWQKPWDTIQIYIVIITLIRS